MPRPKKQPVVESVVQEKEVTPKPTIKNRRRTLDEVFKYRHAKYKTPDASEYKASLAKMNKIDLQRECIRVGLLPHDKREIMGERLMKMFVTYQAGLQPVARYNNGTGRSEGRAQDILSKTAPRLG